ncbi:MAG: FAD-dependent oxidoreductase, partial [Candidatus Hodgkinia cicadicola]
MKPEVSPLAEPKVIKTLKTSPTAEVEVKTSQPVASEAKTPQPVDFRRSERLVVVGSGLSAYSASLYATSAATPPLMITGPTLGGALASQGNLDHWPGAAADAKSSDFAAALHVQAARLGTQFMYDSVVSIDTTTQPYNISTKSGGLLSASAIIIATGLSPKTLNLPGEASLLGRSVFTSAASINGPHKDAALVGSDSSAVEAALALSKIVSQVTLVCAASQLSCPPSLASQLSQTTNIHVECGTEVAAYVVDESDGGPLLRGLSVKRSNKPFTINATIAVLALGSEPKVDFLPPEAKTAEGFIKSNLTAKGIFAAGTIAESTPSHLAMIAASGFAASMAAVNYLSAAASKSPAQPAAASIEIKPKLAEAEVKAPASAPTSEAKVDVIAKPAEAGKQTSTEASAESPVSPTSSAEAAPSPEVAKQAPSLPPNSST